MLQSSKVHYKSSDLFSRLREHSGKDMNRPLQSAAGGIHETCIGIIYEGMAFPIVFKMMNASGSIGR